MLHSFVHEARSYCFTYIALRASAHDYEYVLHTCARRNRGAQNWLHLRIQRMQTHANVRKHSARNMCNRVQNMCKTFAKHMQHVIIFSFDFLQNIKNEKPDRFLMSIFGVLFSWLDISLKVSQKSTFKKK